MATQTVEGRFLASSDKGEVSSLLMQPSQAEWMLVLGHGASTNMRHATLQSLAEAMAAEGIATFRYNFPYSEAGGGRNSNDVCMQTIRAAVAAAHTQAADLRIVAGGHSFSGRMTTMAMADGSISNVHGLVLFGFPLHPSGKPSIERAAHLNDVQTPMLFLSGTRDKLAELELLQPLCQKLGQRATLHLLDTADHGFKILKRTRKTEEDVFAEMARATSQWLSELA